MIRSSKRRLFTDNILYSLNTGHISRELANIATLRCSVSLRNLQKFYNGEIPPPPKPSMLLVLNSIERRALNLVNDHNLNFHNNNCFEGFCTIISQRAAKVLK